MHTVQSERSNQCQARQKVCALEPKARAQTARKHYSVLGGSCIMPFNWISGAEARMPPVTPCSVCLSERELSKGRFIAPGYELREFVCPTCRSRIQLVVKYDVAGTDDRSTKV